MGKGRLDEGEVEVVECRHGDRLFDEAGSYKVCLRIKMVLSHDLFVKKSTVRGRSS